MDCWARCEPLRTWARAHGFELDGVPDDFAVLDQALDQASGVLGDARSATAASACRERWR